MRKPPKTKSRVEHVPQGDEASQLDRLAEAFADCEDFARHLRAEAAAARRRSGDHQQCH
jgi:hypothetical protein